MHGEQKDRKRPGRVSHIGHFMSILETIAPIFIIIAFGFFLKSREVLSEDFIAEVNRFVFQFPLPFLIFIGIIKAGLKNTAWLPIISVTVPAFIVVGIAE
ncbi:MAG: Membrane transport protein [Deltaproteobacteria bacterium]|nr:Membrane transport protein [Deltaproteobacteria bacterium]